MLTKMVPSKTVISSALEVAGLVAIVAGVWGLAGTWWGVIAGGLSAVLYGTALSR